MLLPLAIGGTGNGVFRYPGAHVKLKAACIAMWCSVQISGYVGYVGYVIFRF